jgi:hypothetical protein
MIRSAFFASLHQELQNSCNMNVQQPGNARNALSFKQEPQNHLSLLDRRIQFAKGTVAGIDTDLIASRTLIALVSLAGTETPAPKLEFLAGHADLDPSSSTVHNEGVKQPCGFVMR